jgi:hypothetical protein
LRIPRQPVRLKAWKGPLPSKRITPPAIFGDFFVNAKAGAGRAAVEVECAGVESEAMAGSSPSPVLEAAAPIRLRFEPAKAGSPDAGPQPRWAGFGRALMGLQRAVRRRVLHPAITLHAITSSITFPSAAEALVAAAPPLEPPGPRLPLSSSSPSSWGAPFTRSFVDVVSRGASATIMVGPTRPVPQVNLRLRRRRLLCGWWSRRGPTQGSNKDPQGFKGGRRAPSCRRHQQRHHGHNRGFALRRVCQPPSLSLCRNNRSIRSIKGSFSRTLNLCNNLWCNNRCSRRYRTHQCNLVS